MLKTPYRFAAFCAFCAFNLEIATFQYKCRTPLWQQIQLEIRNFSSSRIATFQYQCGTQSTLWQLQIKNCNCSVQVSVEITQSALPQLEDCNFSGQELWLGNCNFSVPVQFTMYVLAAPSQTSQLFSRCTRKTCGCEERRAKVNLCANRNRLFIGLLSFSFSYKV